MLVTSLWSVVSCGIRSVSGKGLLARKDIRGENLDTIVHVYGSIGEVFVVLLEDKAGKLLSRIHVARSLKKVEVVSCIKQKIDDKKECQALISACDFLAKDEDRNGSIKQKSFRIAVKPNDGPGKWKWSLFFVRIPGTPGGHFMIFERADFKVIDVLPGM